MDWTVEDDMVDGLFCLTLTARRGGYTPFVQAGAETSETGAEAVEPDPGSSWEGHCGIVRPLRVPLMICPLRRTYVVRKTDELLCGGYKWMSRFEAPCSCTRWTGEHWVEQVSRIHGTASER